PFFRLFRNSRMDGSRRPGQASTGIATEYRMTPSKPERLWQLGVQLGPHPSPHAFPAKASKMPPSRDLHPSGLVKARLTSTGEDPDQRAPTYGRAARPRTGRWGSRRRWMVVYLETEALHR